LSNNERQSAVISSALWAAVGDALGWMTELGNEGTVAYRTGNRRIYKTTEWKRRIGGRYGPTVDLPAGTYSDDTQLRLAVSRATRDSGEFDLEAFSKVELPVWQSYSLGAGRGTSIAAANLSKSSVSWFSNFFGSRSARGYFDAGGNGAAMRIQPHVWKGPSRKRDNFVQDVLRDSIVTHGHPQGFCGAVFHSLCLAHALNYRELPDFESWREFSEQLENLPAVVQADEKLGLFWLGPWEERFGSSLSEAISFEIARIKTILQDLEGLLGEDTSNYLNILKITGSFQEQTRGAGLNSALSAAVLAWFGRHQSNEDTLLLGANAIGSDTDTICTMAGALLGAARPSTPTWEIQDREYITSEAIRLCQGQTTQRFRYPDLIGWTPPATQSDAIGSFRGRVFLAGLGQADPYGQTWKTSEAVWQWYQLEFGQTVLAKRRLKVPELNESSLPGPVSTSMRHDVYIASNQQELFNKPNERRASSTTWEKPTPKFTESAQPHMRERTIDELTDWVIQEEFNPQVIGNAFLEVARGPHAVERTLAFSSIVSKAISARRRRRDK
jgi:ADP-ribosylglycohydrolase